MASDVPDDDRRDEQGRANCKPAQTSPAKLPAKPAGGAKLIISGRQFGSETIDDRLSLEAKCTSIGADIANHERTGWKRIKIQRFERGHVNGPHTGRLRDILDRKAKAFPGGSQCRPKTSMRLQYDGLRQQLKLSLTGVAAR